MKTSRLTKAYKLGVKAYKAGCYSYFLDTELAALAGAEHARRGISLELVAAWRSGWYHASAREHGAKS